MPALVLAGACVHLAVLHLSLLRAQQQHADCRHPETPMHPVPQAVRQFILKGTTVAMLVVRPAIRQL